MAAARPHGPTVNLAANAQVGVLFLAPVEVARFVRAVARHAASTNKRRAMDTIAIGLPGEAEPVTAPGNGARDYQTEAELVQDGAVMRGCDSSAIGLMAYAFLPQSPPPALQSGVTLPAPKPIPACVRPLRAGTAATRPNIVPGCNEVPTRRR